ncbi:MAG: sigma-70 family RNA polymerase sigma factor [Nitrospirae bacterium]|nr:sigma-70 family RNA polymerase sigma factor [Nitrospirota bacterium]
MGPHSLSDPEQWVNQHGDYLFRCALLRMRDPRLAEDVVQETLLAALQGRDRFAGESSERSWLVGILKHKVIDHFRKNSREGPSEDVERLINEQDQSFHGRGGWKRDTTGPKEWTEDPGIILERKEFWDVLKRCVSELPPRMAHVFSLREIDDLSSEEICKALNITATNLWVMLHRARMHLRRCLEINCMGLKAS